ncbi:MAG: Cna B-type domain-containing protein [Flexilinea sp.]|nr:Cna B-type domain-containing protein [Flexilinea sp.]
MNWYAFCRKRKICCGVSSLDCYQPNQVLTAITIFLCLIVCLFHCKIVSATTYYGNLNIQVIWDDSNNQYGLRPSSITYSTGGGKYSCTVNESNSWKCSMYVIRETSDMNGYQETQRYSFSPNTPSGYTASWTPGYFSMYPNTVYNVKTGTVKITFSLSTETKSIAVTGAWSDNSNKFSTRPSSITFNAYSGSSTTSAGSCTANSSGSWKCSISGLLAVATYTIKETAPTGYTVNTATVASGTSNTTATITNTMSTKTVTVTDSFSDQDNKFSTRPSGNVTLTAYLGTTSVGSCAAAVGGSCNITSLANSKAYTIKGSAVTGYTTNEPSVATSATSATVTYTMSTKTVSVTDSFSDQDNKFSTRPSGNVTLTAYLGTTSVGSCSAAVGSSCNITSLASSKAYTIKGSAVTGYSSNEPSVAASATSATVTYTMSTKTVAVTDSFSDQNNKFSTRPSGNVTLTAYLGTTSVGSCAAAVGSSCNITSLASSKAYTVKGSAVTGYTSNEPSVADSATSATVTYTMSTKTITITTLWDDNENFENRPSSITVDAYIGNGTTTVGSCTATAAESWTCSISDLAAKDASGADMSYTVKAQNIPNYRSTPVSTAGSNVSITNALALTNVVVRKIWIDNLNSDNYRPTSVCLQLYDNGTPTQYLITLTGTGDEWSYTFQDVPASANYSIVENGVTCQP